MLIQDQRHIFIFFSLFILGLSVSGQVSPSKEKSLVIAFWNVENLYDTLNDDRKNDDDFTPEGLYRWNSERYQTKLRHLSDVIVKLGTHFSNEGPAIMGFCEVENKEVLLDLVKTPLLAHAKYEVVHIEGPDARGIDPAFIYNPKHFKLFKARTFPVRMITDSLYRTRQILMIVGELEGHRTAVFVNHWPSRRGGEKKSRANRNEAARVLKKVTDSLMTREQGTQVIIMGDLNDDPVNESVKRIMGTCDRIQDCDLKFYNPMEQLHREGIGSLAFRDSWNLFDQIILSKNCFAGANQSFLGAWVYNDLTLRNPSGRYKGYPHRTYSGTNYTGGYSDHFPVYIALRAH